MKEYLFLCTIGPVKDFISNARKSQDLFGGSALLSHLTDLAMREAVSLFEQGVGIIISPYLGSTFKPNRFVAKIKDTKQLDLKKTGTDIENTIKTEFKRIANLAFKNGLEKPKDFDEQLDDYLEIYWLYYPLEKDYKAAYKQLFIELAALKNVTSFKNFEETGRKCSVDGVYNVKVYRNLSTKSRADLTIVKNEKHLKIWHLKDGEGLSAVSLTKRLFNKEKPKNLSEPHLFPSTAKVSLMKLIEASKEIEEFIQFNKLINSIGHSDDQLYYFDNIEQILNETGKANTDTFKNAHKAWTKALEKAKINEPFTKYYALIRFDGDRMGNWLLGNQVIEGKLEAFHAAFTIRVNEFAEDINKNLVAPRGKVIYAGGEDFMAMVNIHSLFEVMEMIQVSYKKFINDKLKEFKRNKNDVFTISMGIAIAHYKQPLSMVLDRAKIMEHQAKENGRNRYAIGVMKHSGSSLDTLLPWNVSEKSSIDSLNYIFERLEKNDFSTAFLLNIYNFFEQYGDTMNKDLVKSKIKLYVAQSLNDFNNKDLLIEEMNNQIFTLLEMFKANETYDYKSFAHLLLILDFLKRKTV